MDQNLCRGIKGWFPNFFDYFFKKSIIDSIEWIPYVISGENKVESTMELLQKNIVCGATWKLGDICFKCRTCETDPTCAICKDCFQNGNHEGHNYSMVKSSTGMCDCGDLNSWAENGFCKNHKEGSKKDPLKEITIEMKDLIEKIFKSLIFKL